MGPEVEPPLRLTIFFFAIIKTSFIVLV